VAMAGTLIGCANAAFDSMAVKQNKIEQYSYLANCTYDYVKIDQSLNEDI
jgi:hypothetical protein